MINLKALRKVLEENLNLIEWNPKGCREDVSKRITIKRKKKMILEQIPNGDIKLKRRSVIKIEIIE